VESLPHCKECGLVNLWAERYPNANIVRGELAAIIREKEQQARRDRKAFKMNLWLNLRRDIDVSRPTPMEQFTQQQLLAGERILRELENRQNGGTVTN
jgi:hypothetical protein